MTATTPDKVLKFCPKCGSDRFHHQNGDYFDCAGCGFRMHINPAIGVAVVLKDEEGKILFTRRAKNPMAGKLDLPGGFVDIMESAENAAVREIKEELHLDIRADKLVFLGTHPNIYEYKGLTYYVLDIAFTYQLSSFSNIKLSEDEIADYYLVDRKEINMDEIGFISIKYFISKILNDHS